LKGWLTARSMARGLPPPVADHGGWRVDTNLPTEARRFVFAHAGEPLRALAESIVAPLIFLKLCGSEATMRALVPAQWQIQGGSYLMTCERQIVGPTRLEARYRVDVSRSGPVTAVRIVTGDDELAASGFAAEAEGMFVYDRIVTEPAHRRRGLGILVMTTLGAARRHAASKQVLVATEDGKALYSALGWTVPSPYTSAFIPVP
jgi:GNAT superfamily N-acetyltransferase